MSLLRMTACVQLCKRGHAHGFFPWVLGWGQEMVVMKSLFKPTHGTDYKRLIKQAVVSEDN